MDSDLSHEALRRFDELEARVKALEEANTPAPVTDVEDEDEEDE